MAVLLCTFVVLFRVRVWVWDTREVLFLKVPAWNVLCSSVPSYVHVILQCRKQKEKSSFPYKKRNEGGFPPVMIAMPAGLGKWYLSRHFRISHSKCKLPSEEAGLALQNRAWNIQACWLNTTWALVAAYLQTLIVRPTMQRDTHIIPFNNCRPKNSASHTLHLLHN